MNRIDAGTLRKFEALRERLAKTGTLAIAFSGGVDSSFLLKTAHDVLGRRCVAMTARSEVFPSRELAEARKVARKYGIRHIVIDYPDISDDAFVANPPDRCYRCKTGLFKKLSRLARAKGIAHVADGSNADDAFDFRPGNRAARELGILSPLLDAGLDKKEIRSLSRKLGLPTWNKPSLACLASRMPYGEAVTREKLRQVDRAEEFLRGLGFGECRVRHHGTIARIEAPAGDLSQLVSEFGRKIIERFQKIGFVYVTLDLSGYRTGSMNEVLRPR